VHIGTAPAIQDVPKAADAANQRRFTRRPKAPEMPGPAGINKPAAERT
jgi:hypothetical protein